MPPRKPNPPPAIALPRSLRTGRALHPGEPDKPRPKRSTGEVQAEKAAKSQAQLDKAQNRDFDIAQTAEIEAKTRQEYAEKMKNAHHPPESTLTKTLRPRKVSELPSAAAGLASELLPGEVRDISSDSGEEYQAPSEPEGDDGGDESEREQVLDMSGDEEIAGVRKTSNKKKKGSLRKEVNAAASSDGANSEALTDGTHGKRKATEQRQQVPDSKKKKRRDDGLHDDWQNRSVDQWSFDLDDDSHMHFDGRRSPNVSNGRSRSASSGMQSVRSSSSQAPSNKNRSDDENEGGISDNSGEGEERSQLGAQASRRGAYFGGGSKMKETRVRSLAKIAPTTSVSTFISPTASSQIVAARTLKKDEIRLSHLPAHLQTTFDSLLGPRLREAFGYTDPWEQPTDEVLVELWADAFPLEPKLNFAKPEGVIVKKLIEDRLATWRHNFGSTALQFLQNSLFPLLPENSRESRAAWCTWQISGKDHQQPFYYISYDGPDSEDEGKKVVATGLFQSSLIAAILGTHISSISPISPELRSNRKPIGALVLSVQAAKRALMRWTTGEEIKPRRPFSDFSKTNWGDHLETREGHPILIRTTSNLIKVASQLKEKQWEKILKAATEASKMKRESIVAPAPDMAASEEPDFELIDDDSDLADE